MVRQPVRLALLLGAITALAVSPARADHCSAPVSAPCGPTTRSVQVTQCVPETYTTKRTVYKVECRQEQVDSFRCERVPVYKERVVTHMKRVPIYKEEVRKVCHKVTTYEERTVTKKVWKTTEHTVMQKRLKSLGHWECREACQLFSGGLFSGHGHGRGCNDSCNDSCRNGHRDDCRDDCRPARTRKVWVYCPQYECCPVKVCKRVCVEECVKCRVPVCRNEWREQRVKVCTYQCVPEQRTEKYCEYTTRQVPCKVTRQVRVCVPREETVTCTRMVPRTVTREVACPAPARHAECRPARHADCNDSCRRGCGDRGHGWFRNNGGCCRSNDCH
jgi:hypothetical protein